ncbi:hypothetical protein CYMTET_38934 [Cymbomonas tetramitiformis]|uniref:Uncharacterized protein n=1 Tax=Cymbomonas tetramitiformis TaxID=36881 RepID=A0AAE0CB22_9CHLO|nr:hypothetical protein CYMTET_38934 [Cymbomonas tetramitiformis]
MLAKRRRLDKLPQASIFSSLGVKRGVKSTNNDPVVRRPKLSDTEKKRGICGGDDGSEEEQEELNEAEKRWQPVLYKAFQKSKVVVGRPKKTAFENGSLPFQKVDCKAIRAYVASRDYAVFPKRGAFESDEDFFLWLDMEENNPELAQTAQTASSVDNFQKKTYRWSPLEIEVVMKKYKQLGGNKLATVRWFRENLSGSIIAARLHASDIQWWEKTYVQATSNLQSAPFKRGRAKALNEASEFYRRVVQVVKKHLAAGLPGNATVISSLIRSLVAREDPSSLSSKFTVSPSWTYAFLHSEDMVARRATTNRKEPNDWEFQFERQILRIAHIVRLYNIPPALVIGFDHSGFQILPLKNTTWAERGSSVVPMIGLDDMRQITGVVVEALGDNFEGLVVGMQLVYQGKTDRCLPDREHRAKDMFSDFIFGYTYNHWADEDTNVDLFADIIVVHLLAVKARLKLLDDHKALVILDAWPVQKTESFRGRVRSKWPWIVLLYIFAGGTGRSQKYDIDGANVMKPKLNERAGLYVQKQFTERLDAGENPEEIRLDLTLSTLKVQQLYWMGEVYAEFKANVPARTEGWVKTKVPLAFTQEWQERALVWHEEGKLWKGNTVEEVPVGEEPTPLATQDDMDVGPFTDGAAAQAMLAPTHEPLSSRGTFESEGGAAVIANKNKAKQGITAEDLEYELEDMTPET